MNIEIYSVESSDGYETHYGPWGYKSQRAAYEAAKEHARETNGTVCAMIFEYDDSELIDDFRAGGVDNG